MTARTPRRAVLTLAALVCALGAPLASAQEDGQAATPRLSVQLTAVGGRPLGAVRPGDRLFLSARLVNPSDSDLQIRRVAAAATGAVRFEDPRSDGIDNDANGLIDDAREGLVEITAENTLLWTLSGSDAQAHDPVTAPRGRSAPWRVSAVALEGFAPDATDASMSFIASSREDGRLKLSRLDAPAVLDDTPFRAMWRVINGPADSAAAFSHGDSARWRLEVAAPPGYAPDLTLSIDVPPSVRDFAIHTARVGADMVCLGGQEPQISNGRLTWRLGNCVIDPPAGAGDAPDHSVALEASGLIADADAFAHPFSRASWRYDRMEATLSAAGAAFQRVWTPVRVRGPLLSVAPLEAFEPPPETFRGGDFLRHRFRVSNVGDVAARDLAAWLRPHPALNCAFARLDPIDRASVLASAPEAACGQAVGLGAAAPLEPGESLVVEVSSPISLDAPLDAPAALELGVFAASLGGGGARVDSRPFSVAPEPPAAAAFGPAESWRSKDGVLTLAPTLARRARLEASLPPGRAHLTLELRAQLFDVASGAPIGPAALRIDRAALAEAESGISVIAAAEDAPHASEQEFGAQELDAGGALSDGWRVVRVPLGVVGYESRGLDRQLSAAFDIDVAVRDSPEIRQGRAVRITAALQAGAQMAVPASGALEAFIVEPRLNLAASAIDADGVIAASEHAAFLAEACNVGAAAAYDVVLSAALSPGFVARPPDQVAFQIRRRDSPEGSPADPPPVYDPDAQVLTGALDPDAPLDAGFCLRLGLRAQAAATLPEDADLGARFVLAPYANRPAPETGRMYAPGPPRAARLRAPSLRFGPLRRAAVKAEETVTYESTLTAPLAGGPFAVELQIDSSADLRWSLEAVDASGAARSWRDGALLQAGESVTVRGTASTPPRLPPGWVDTTVLRATAAPTTASEPNADQSARTANLSWVTVADDPLSAQIVTEKLMALDRDCSGDVDNETAQDALFEAFKEVGVGECVVFRIAFENAGDSAMERITIRDAPPAGTTYIPRSQGIFKNPANTSSPDYHQEEDGVLIWDFLGSYPSGAAGAVQYSVIVEGA